MIDLYTAAHKTKHRGFLKINMIEKTHKHNFLQSFYLYRFKETHSHLAGGYGRKSVLRNSLIFRIIRTKKVQILHNRSVCSVYEV